MFAASMKLSSFGNSQWNLFTCCMKFLLSKNFSTFLLPYFHDGVFCFSPCKSGDASVLIVG